MNYNLAISITESQSFSYLRRRNFEYFAKYQVLILNIICLFIFMSMKLIKICIKSYITSFKIDDYV